MIGSRAAGRSAVAFTVVAVLLGGACSVSTHEDPVAAGNVFDELVQSTTSTTSATSPDDATKLEPVYFLQTSEGSTRLVPVDRSFDLDAGPQAVLANLFTQPPDTDGDERPTEAGLTSRIPENAVLVSATMASENSSELVIDVTGIFGSLEGSPLRNALAQIVWTATSSPNVREVSFRRNGEPVPALVAGGGTVEGAVDRTDYTSLN